MFEPSLKVAIVGCGKMAANHLDKVIGLVPMNNIALCDLEPEKMTLLGQMYGITARFDSLERLIAEFRPAIYHIVTPPNTHKSLALACLRAGGNVYIEKPVCLNCADFDDLQTAACLSQGLICVGHQRPVERDFKRVKELVAQNTLGRVIHLHAYDGGPYLALEDAGLSKGWWTGFTGGMFFDLLPHIMSVFSYVVDDLNLEHSFICRNSRGRPSEMHGFLSSKTSPVTCDFHISFSTSFLQNYYEVQCEKGVIVVNCRNKYSYVIRRGHFPELIDRLMVGYSKGFKIAMGNTRSILSLLAGRYDSYEGTGELIARFYEAVVKRGESPTPLPSVRKVVELCEDTIGNSFGGFNLAVESEEPKPSRESPDADVLVTGAGGFIGKHLIRRLLDEGKTVRSIVRRPVASDFISVEDGAKLQVYVGDLTNRRFVTRACRGVKTVYHLAAATKGDLFAQVDGTCVGTRNLLEAARENDVARFVHVSSVSILDQTQFPHSGRVDESFPEETYPLKRGAYTYSKLRAEEMVRKFAADGRLAISILRPGIVWGPGSNKLLLETHFHVGRRILVVLGRGGKRLPLIYVENLVDALTRAGESKDCYSDPMNIVDPDNPSQRKYLKMLSGAGGDRYFGIFIPISVVLPLFWMADKTFNVVLKRRSTICYQLKSKSNRVTYSIDKVQSALGWNSRITFSEALRRYLDWIETTIDRKGQIQIGNDAQADSAGTI